MWFIFPQLKGLGKNDTATYYGIRNIEEARAYLQHPVLGKHLVEISQAVLNISDNTAVEIFGTPDDLKLFSCMTLFANVDGAPVVFRAVLEKFFHGQSDPLTLDLLATVS